MAIQSNVGICKIHIKPENSREPWDGSKYDWSRSVRKEDHYD